MGHLTWSYSLYSHYLKQTSEGHPVSVLKKTVPNRADRSKIVQIWHLEGFPQKFFFWWNGKSDFATKLSNMPPFWNSAWCQQNDYDTFSNAQSLTTHFLKQVIRLSISTTEIKAVKLKFLQKENWNQYSKTWNFPVFKASHWIFSSLGAETNYPLLFCNCSSRCLWSDVKISWLFLFLTYLRTFNTIWWLVLHIFLCPFCFHSEVLLY